MWIEEGESGRLAGLHRELWELVCAEIRNLIISGEFAPGERLVEAALADRFAVSRGPVRRALMELERMGLVTSSARRGVHVATFSRADIDEPGAPGPGWRVEHVRIPPLAISSTDLRRRAANGITVGWLWKFGPKT